MQMKTVDTTNSLQGKPSDGSPASVSVAQRRVDREDRPTPLLEKLFRGVTSPRRLLPDFLIIGAQRGGTTSLYNYLQAHPNIHSASIKEVHFFDRKFQKGVHWYRAHFPMRLTKVYAGRFRHEGFVTGEASPAYLFHPQVPERIARLLPRVKLIVLLRNPVDRAYSQYYHTLQLGYETLTFEEAIAAEEERIAGEREKISQDEYYQSHAFKHQSYLSRGIYVDQLQV